MTDTLTKTAPSRPLPRWTIPDTAVSGDAIARSNAAVGASAAGALWKMEADRDNRLTGKSAERHRLTADGFAAGYFGPGAEFPFLRDTAVCSCGHKGASHGRMHWSMGDTGAGRCGALDGACLCNAFGLSGRLGK